MIDQIVVITTEYPKDDMNTFRTNDIIMKFFNEFICTTV